MAITTSNMINNNNKKQIKYDDAGFRRWQKIYDKCEECKKFGANLSLPILLNRLLCREEPSDLEKNAYGNYCLRFLAHYDEKHREEFESGR